MKFEFRSTRVELFSGDTLFVNGSISCNPGDRILLLGENGIGKSTVLLLLHAAASHPSIGGEGSIHGHIDKLDWTAISVSGTEALRSAYVLQEPRQNFICRASSDEIILPLLDASKSANQIINKLEELVDAADVYERQFWRRQVDTLSSGEQQRVAVAAALAAEPSLLLWDEALARVDDRSAKMLVKLLNVGFPNGILIAATHRAWRYERLFEKPFTSTITLTRAENTILITQTPGTPTSPQEINFVTRPLWQKYIEPIDEIQRLFNNGMRLFGTSNERIAELEDLDFLSKRSEDPVAHLRSATIRRGLNFVVGKSGSGKTLFLRFLAGQVRLNPHLVIDRSVYAEGHVVSSDIGPFAAARANGVTAFLPAEPFRWITEDSVEAELRMFHQDDELNRRLTILEDHRISRARNPDYLSYGQKKLVATLSLPNKCDLVCLDEPFADLGLSYIEAIESFIADQIDRENWRSVVMSHSSDVSLRQEIA